MTITIVNTMVHSEAAARAHFLPLERSPKKLFWTRNFVAMGNLFALARLSRHP